MYEQFTENIMGTPYNLAISEPPNPRKAEFQSWLDDLVAYRLNETPLHREHKVYISQDSNLIDLGGGILVEPTVCTGINHWQATTWPAIKTAYPTGGLTVYFNRNNQRWFNGFSNSIRVDRSNTTITSTGIGTIPVFHGTETLNELSTTGFFTFSGSAQFAILGSPMATRTFYGLVYEWDTNPYILASTGFIFDRMASSGAVTASGQYHFDSASNRLTILPHPNSGTININNLRVITHSGVNDPDSMFLIPTGVDNVRIDSIGSIGVGGYTSQIWNIMAKPTGLGTVVINNCLALYGAFHNVGMLTSDISGGIITISNNTFGWTKDQTGVPGVTYNGSGSHEAIYYNNNILGCIVDYGRNANLERCSHGIYAHTNGPARSKLFVSYKDNIYAGYGGASFAPRNGSPVTDTNKNDGFVTQCRDFIVDLRMDGGNHPTRRNVGNCSIIFGMPVGHVGINRHFFNFRASRQTLVTTLEAVEFRTTDYDERGFQWNSIYDITVDPITGTHQVGLISNSLSAGTEPDRQGVIEDENEYCTTILTIMSGFNITGNWLTYALSRNANTATGTIDRNALRKNYRNSLFLTKNLGSVSLSGFPTMFMTYPVDPDGPLYSYGGNTARGGAENCAFWNYRLEDRLVSATTGFGINHFLTTGNPNTSINLSGYPGTVLNNPTGIPLSTYQYVGQNKSIDTKHSGQYIEYDFYWRPRSISGAYGAVEMNILSVFIGNRINSLSAINTSNIFGNNFFVSR